MTSRRPLHILAPTRYPWRFNGPRHSQHRIENRNFLPFNYVHKALEGTTVFNPWPPRRFDLVHAFNRIPLGVQPFIIGFESHLPRGFGLESTRYFHAMTRMLAAPRCRGIIAISQHARRSFEATHRDSPLRDVLLSKLSVRYPNIAIPETASPLDPAQTRPFVVSFVGNHFVRKGGCVAVRLAEMALAKGLPVVVEIGSSVQVGPAVWTDPLNPRFFDRYRPLLSLPNVRWHKSLSNTEVHALFRRSHVSLLTTFCDTFGYSAIESMVHGTPVIATRQGALPEFIVDGRNGLLLDLELAAHGEWIHVGHPDRASPAYEAIVEAEIERLAHATCAAVERLIAEPDQLDRLRRQARADAARQFNAQDASLYWDQAYDDALASRAVGQAADPGLRVI
jgi:glycosyltransferase involved in cell wall biosynthesis